MSLRDTCVTELIIHGFNWTPSQLSYVQSNLNQYLMLLLATSAEEFILKFELSRQTLHIPVVDYLSLFAGSMVEAVEYIGVPSLSMSTVIQTDLVSMMIDLIDNYDLFDEAIRTPWFQRSLLSLRAQNKKSSAMYKLSELYLAHMFTKFPDMYDMNFNYVNRKGRRFQRFTEEHAHKALKVHKQKIIC